MLLMSEIRGILVTIKYQNKFSYLMYTLGFTLIYILITINLQLCPCLKNISLVPIYYFKHCLTGEGFKKLLFF